MQTPTSIYDTFGRFGFRSLIGGVILNIYTEDISYEGVLLVTILRELGKINMLIVEDDPFNRMLVRSMLDSVNVRCYEAEHGEEALDVLDEHAVNVILLDLHMPIMDGYETLEAIKKNSNYDSISIIAMTTDEEEKKRLYASGADGFISKPFRLEEFETTIYNVLQAKRQSTGEETPQAECVASNGGVVYTQEEVELSQKDFFLKLISLKTKLHPMERMRAKTVASLTNVFALKLGYSKQEANNLYIASLIKDIGFIADDCGYPNASGLDNKQYILMGYQTLEGALVTDFSTVAKKVILQHREHYDGTGIPYGLKGDAISEGANIVIIVESFDMMMQQNEETDMARREHDVYRKMSAKSGKKFHPEYLEIFLESFHDFAVIRQKITQKEGV